jgi:ADP-ribose pyrophosphatase YjhB (NUDIX family)
MTEPSQPDLANFVRQVPAGDDRERLVCDSCGFVHYQNPKVIVGSVAVWEDRVLLCRRAIAPRRDFWTLPAGYLELNEATMQGARREAWEEARAEIEIDQLLAVYTILRISQVQLIYRARLLSPEIAVGPESLEVGLFAWEDIPWEELAFPSVHWALAHYREAIGRTGFAPYVNPPGESGRMADEVGL